MIDSALYHRLTPVVRRFQMRRLFLTLASIWTVATLIGLLLWSLKANGTYHSMAALPTLLATTFIASVIGIWYSMRGGYEFARTAKDLEERFPELDSSLLTAIEQQPPTPHGTLGYLQQEVVRKAVYHGYQNSWLRIVPHWQLLILPVLAGAGLLAFMISVIGQALTTTPLASASVSEDSTAAVVDTPLFEGGFSIEPGDTLCERCRWLMSLARFIPEQGPANAELILWEDHVSEPRQPM